MILIDVGSLYVIDFKWWKFHSLKLYFPGSLEVMKDPLEVDSSSRDDVLWRFFWVTLGFYHLIQT